MKIPRTADPVLWLENLEGYGQSAQMAAAGLSDRSGGGRLQQRFCQSPDLCDPDTGEYPWVILTLPLAGLVIVFLYQKIGKEDRGTNQVLSFIRSKDEVPFRAAPLIFISTILTHLAGGSAGREGAAIQLGGSIGNQLGRWIRLDEEDRHVIVMCGMSGAFAAVFGTPMAAAVFAMEVVSVGIMYYAALLPCVISALIASGFAASFGIHPESFHVSGVVKLTMESGLKMGVVALACGAVSILFCVALGEAEKLYRRWLKNPYLRVAAAGLLVIAVTLLLGTTDYLGAGNNLIEQAVEAGQARPWDFLLKLLLTAVTMRAGFRGGEIVPSFASEPRWAVSWASCWGCRLPSARRQEWRRCSAG